MKWFEMLAKALTGLNKNSGYTSPVGRRRSGGNRKHMTKAKAKTRRGMAKASRRANRKK